MIFPPHCWPREMTVAQRRDVKTWLDDEGSRITSFCYPLLDNNPNGTDRLMRAYTLDRYREAIDMAAEWGCPYVVAIPGPARQPDQPADRMDVELVLVEGMQELVRYAKGTGVKLLLENVPFTFLPTAQDMADTARLIGPEVGGEFRRVQFGLYQGRCGCGDPGDAGAIAAKPAYLGFWAMANSSMTGSGTGIVEPGPAAKALQDIGYTGETVLEIITDALRPGADPDGDIIAATLLFGGKNGVAIRN